MQGDKKGGVHFELEWDCLPRPPRWFHYPRPRFHYRTVFRHL